MDSLKTVVIDAGIATEENLKLLRELNYNYIRVSRKKLTRYEPVNDSGIVTIKDRLNQPIELLSVKPSDEDSGDRFIWIHSPRKAIKESGMEQQAVSRYEQELIKIKTSLSGKGGTKQVDKVNRRIGRAQQKYPSVQFQYQIELIYRDNIATDLIRLKKEEDKKLNGVYFLRTTPDEKRRSSSGKFTI